MLLPCRCSVAVGQGPASCADAVHRCFSQAADPHAPDCGLAQDTRLYSPDGLVYLIAQSDGNLVLYKETTPEVRPFLIIVSFLRERERGITSAELPEKAQASLGTGPHFPASCSSPA